MPNIVHCHMICLLLIAIGSSILVYPEDIFLPVNSTVSLVCIAFGVPVPSVVWSQNGSDLTSNSSHFQVEERQFEKRGLYMAKSVLHVCGFSLLLEGMYSCTANNSIREVSITTKVSLKGENHHM